MKEGEIMDVNDDPMQTAMRHEHGHILIAKSLGWKIIGAKVYHDENSYSDCLPIGKYLWGYCALAVWDYVNADKAWADYRLHALQDLARNTPFLKAMDRTILKDYICFLMGGSVGEGMKKREFQGDISQIESDKAKEIGLAGVFNLSDEFRNECWDAATKIIDVATKKNKFGNWETKRDGSRVYAGE